jgi:N6-L-threonylcarbamoyladenine synthase
VLTLGLETSCDETAAAVVDETLTARSSVINSQIPIHAKYGGVVPELASRNHVMAAIPVVEQALAEAGVGLKDIGLVAVTSGPGLAGSLLVGVETAKALAFSASIPLMGINHLEGHLLSPFVDNEARDRLRFPYLGLIVSGGHTLLLHAVSLGDYRCLGRTLDDAAGEAFDKVAKRLGGPYPGGPFVEKMAAAGEPGRFKLPSPMLGRGLNFSFSGLKTAASTLIGRLETSSDPQSSWLADLCAGVQRAVVRVLIDKTLHAVDELGCRQIVIAGGVACNSALREGFLVACSRADVELVLPAKELCTDNAAMIAVVGAMRFPQSRSSSFEAFTLDADANMALGDNS